MMAFLVYSKTLQKLSPPLLSSLLRCVKEATRVQSFSRSMRSLCPFFLSFSLPLLHDTPDSLSFDVSEDTLYG